MNTKKLITRIVAVTTVLSVTMVPMIAQATTALTARSVTISTSAAAASNVTYTAKFTLGTSGQTIGALKFEICDSPLSTISCAGTAGSTGASFGSATLGSVTGLGGSWSANA